VEAGALEAGHVWVHLSFSGVLHLHHLTKHNTKKVVLILIYFLMHVMHTMEEE
jgi:hypothetical protein